MKILIIHTLYQNKGGEETIVENEADQLRQNGIDVRILYFSNGGGKLKSALKFLFLPFNLLSFNKANRVLNDFKPDVVHLHNWSYGASPSIIYAVKKKRIPIAYSIHNYRLLCPSGTLFFEGSLFLNSLNSRFPWKAIHHAVYRNSKIQSFWLAFAVYFHNKIGTWKSVDKYIVNTEFKKRLYLKSGLGLLDNQVVVKPNSTPLPSVVGSLQKKNFFLYVGRLSAEKGIEIMLSAFSKLKFELIIIGDGPLKPIVKEFAERHPNIVYAGLLPNDEVKQYMESASTLIFPSTWYEGMPMTIVESFSVSTPVIASKIGAMENMIKDKINGLHFEVGNIEDLKEKVIYYSNLSIEEKNNLSDGARNSYEEEYTPEKNVQALINIYSSLKK